jgi:hypothetical protein
MAAAVMQGNIYIQAEHVHVQDMVCYIGWQVLWWHCIICGGIVSA